MKTFSLAQVAEEYLPEEWTDSVRWLQRRLRRGEIPGYKVGHVWRMTEDDVAAFLKRYHNSPGESLVPVKSGPRPLSFSSRRRAS